MSTSLSNANLSYPPRATATFPQAGSAANTTNNSLPAPLTASQASSANIRPTASQSIYTSTPSTTYPANYPNQFYYPGASIKPQTAYATSGQATIGTMPGNPNIQTYNYPTTKPSYPPTQQAPSNPQSLIPAQTRRPTPYPNDVQGYHPVDEIQPPSEPLDPETEESISELNDRIRNTLREHPEWEDVINNVNSRDDIRALLDDPNSPPNDFLRKLDDYRAFRVSRRPLKWIGKGVVFFMPKDLKSDAKVIIRWLTTKPPERTEPSRSPSEYFSKSNSRYDDDYGPSRRGRGYDSYDRDNYSRDYDDGFDSDYDDYSSDRYNSRSSSSRYNDRNYDDGYSRPSNHRASNSSRYDNRDDSYRPRSSSGSGNSRLPHQRPASEPSHAPSGHSSSSRASSNPSRSTASYDELDSISTRPRSSSQSRDPDDDYSTERKRPPSHSPSRRYPEDEPRSTSHDERDSDFDTDSTSADDWGNDSSSADDTWKDNLKSRVSDGVSNVGTRLKDKIRDNWSDTSDI